MLYTFSQSYYNDDEIKIICQQLTENDVLLFWQDGVLFLIKNNELFANKKYFVLKEDLILRGLTAFIAENKQCSLQEMVQLTERYFPQVAI